MRSASTDSLIKSFEMFLSYLIVSLTIKDCHKYFVCEDFSDVKGTQLNLLDTTGILSAHYAEFLTEK